MEATLLQNAYRAANENPPQACISRDTNCDLAAQAGGSAQSASACGIPDDPVVILRQLFCGPLCAVFICAE